MKNSTDILIIGGGVIGVSIAYHLAQRKLGKILILEKNALASGSTGCSVASIDSFIFPPALTELAAQSFTFFQRFHDLVGENCGFTQTGSLIIAGEEHANTLQDAVKQNQKAGQNVRLLNNLAEFNALEPLASPEKVASVSYAPQAGYADPVLTTQALAKAAIRMGVDIQSRQTVTGLRAQNGKIIGAETEHGFIPASVIIVAAGPRSGYLLNTLGIDIPFRILRHPVACLRRPSNNKLEHYSIWDFVNGIYARPDKNSLTLLGSIDTKIGYTPTDPNAEPCGHAPTSYTFWAAERFVQRYPTLEESTLCKGWSGILVVSPDWLPTIGAIEEYSGLYCATGFSGHGFQISPAAGNLLAAEISGDPHATELLHPLSPARFLRDQNKKFFHKNMAMLS